MKKITLACSLGLFLYSSTSLAIGVGSVTEYIYSDQTVIGKEIRNTTDSARLVTVRVERIASPKEDGGAIAMAAQNELLLSPARVIMPGGAKEIIKFYYNGPEDDQERYYRIYWTDETISEQNASSSSKSATATTSAQIGTILVVSPRQAKYDYSYSNGVIHNTGNASFKVIAQGECVDPRRSENNHCTEVSYVMPGDQKRFKAVNLNAKKSSVGYWRGGDDFIPVK